MRARFSPLTRQQLHGDFWPAKKEAAQRFLKRRNRGRPSSAGSYVARAEHVHNIIGVGVGRKVSNGSGTPDYAVRIYVRHKLPFARLGVRAIPKHIGGIPTDVCEAGAFRALADGLSAARSRAPRPLCFGASVGFVRGGHLVAGTITAIVERNGKRFILSNNHVLAIENRLPLGANIIQPGTLDAGEDPADRVGTLATFVPLDSGNKLVDAALAKIDEGVAMTNRFSFGITLDSNNPLPPKAQMRVAKVGKISEGDPLRVIGFLTIEGTGPHSNSSGESVNCGLKGSKNNDFHIPVTTDPDTSEFEAIVVEMIPQQRATNWTVGNLNSVRSKKQQVWIEGNRFYDSVHRVNADPANPIGGQPKRFSLWEVHPVTRFLVCEKEVCSDTDEQDWSELH